MAVMTITIIIKIAYILLRLPFGVANGPNDFCLISEPIIDLTNDILRDHTWSPLTLHSPLKEKFDPPPTPSNTKVKKARKLFVPVPFHPAIADGYIDNIITIILAQDNWIIKGQNAAPLAAHTIFRPTSITNSIPRDDATSICKLKAEGTPSETQQIIGWKVDTKQFWIYLPKINPSNGAGQFLPSSNTTRSTTRHSNQPLAG